MTKELLKEVSVSDLRDQLEAKEQMIKNYKEAISSALNYMACPDDLTEINGKCNDQMAFDVLRRALEK
jgi:hypothetical protein